MSSLKILESDVRRVVDLIHSGDPPTSCVPNLWKLEANRENVDIAYQEACFSLWFQMGDTRLNRSGYTNSLARFWEEVVGKKEERK